MEEILRAVPVRFAVCSFVKESEALGVFDSMDANGNPLRTPIDLQPLINAGMLEVVIPDWSVLSSHIIVLAKGGIRGMGEKISGAIARDKNWAIATDDRDAQRKLATLMPYIQVITTLDIVRHWAVTENVTPALLRDVIQRIQIHGKYTPAPSHPLYGWVLSVLSDD
jgi:hypothetical protein